VEVLGTGVDDHEDEGGDKLVSTGWSLLWYPQCIWSTGSGKWVWH